MPTVSEPDITALAPKKMITMRSNPNSTALTVPNTRSSLCSRRLGADLVNEIVVPCGLPALANDQRLNARHAAQRFDEMRVLLRGGHDRLFTGSAIESVG